MNKNYYRIGEFSKKINLTIDTLRFYEKENLIKPKRDQNNIRLYSDNDISWIEFIKRLKQTGMPLKEIKIYSALRYKGDSTINERLSLLNSQKKRLENDNLEIKKHIDFLNKKINTYKSKLQHK
ncbi:MerR family transcriptional regulator [Bombilactobacillus bombi]|uniref:MerR family transcriptional regulator n=1 Tax=Bombilactobacillus bombi TaxID=1303590 RepID=UPI000E56CD07|nr:MerR family transcriptional regulator [Bombilactobacillus bombi]AXX64463.1 MerR family transcriptional regulator [Bombilactobacillus bombi]